MLLEQYSSPELKAHDLSLQSKMDKTERDIAIESILHEDDATFEESLTMTRVLIGIKTTEKQELLAAIATVSAQ